MNPVRLNLLTPGIAVILALAIILGYVLNLVFHFPLLWVVPPVFLILFFIWKPRSASDYEYEKPESFSNTWVTLEAHNAEDLKIKLINDGNYFQITGRSKMYPGKSQVRLNLHLKGYTQHVEIMQSDYSGKQDLDRITDDEGWFDIKFKKFAQTTKVVFGENETVIWES